MEIFQTGTIEQKYEAASYLIRIKVERSDLPTRKEKKEAFANLIHEYCFRYNLKAMKLGKIIGTGAA
jgi:hypothetical protein